MTLLIGSLLAIPLAVVSPLLSRRNAAVLNAAPGSWLLGPFIILALAGWVGLLFNLGKVAAWLTLLTEHSSGWLTVAMPALLALPVVIIAQAVTRRD